MLMHILNCSSENTPWALALQPSCEIQFNEDPVEIKLWENTRRSGERVKLHAENKICSVKVVKNTKIKAVKPSNRHWQA
jgi:hypothetical protein